MFCGVLHRPSPSSSASLAQKRLLVSTAADSLDDLKASVVVLSSSVPQRFFFNTSPLQVPFQVVRPL